MIQQRKGMLITGVSDKEEGNENLSTRKGAGLKHHDEWGERKSRAEIKRRAVSPMITLIEIKMALRQPWPLFFRRMVLLLPYSFDLGVLTLFHPKREEQFVMEMFIILAHMVSGAYTRLNSSNCILYLF